MTEYENMSRKELMAQRAALDKAIAAVGDRERRTALKAAENAAREHGYSLDELVELMGGPRARRGRANAGRSGAAAGGANSPARYRNPDDESQTWSGRGRRPRWVHDAEAKGRKLSDMAI